MAKAVRISLATSLILGAWLVAVAHAQDKKHHLRDGPDFSSVRSELSIPEILKPVSVKAVIPYKMRDLFPEATGELVAGLNGRDTVLEQIEFVARKIYEQGKKTDEVEFGYMNGVISKEILYENVKKDRALGSFLQKFMSEFLRRNTDGGEPDSPSYMEILGRVIAWEQAYHQRRKNKRRERGLHKRIGQTPGPEEKHRMKNVCFYAISGPTPTRAEDVHTRVKFVKTVTVGPWISVRTACYSYWRSFCQRFFIGKVQGWQWKQNQCDRMVNAASYDQPQENTIWDFCRLLPAGEADACYKIGAHIKTTQCLGFPTIDPVQRKNHDACVQAVKGLPENARLN